MAENDHRQGLTAVERFAGFEQLAALGMSVKQTATDRDQVKAALKVAKNTTARAAVTDHAVSFTEAAVLGEFEGDEAATCRLTQVLGTGQFDHVAQQRLTSRGVAALDGDTLVHGDLRADNVLVTAGGAVLVDWPWASRGPAWLATVLLLVEVQRFGGHDVDALLATLPLTRAVDPDDVTGVLAGFAGYFLDTARRPPPPGLPTVREFQRVQGVALLDWVRARVSARSAATRGRSGREEPPAPAGSAG